LKSCFREAVFKLVGLPKLLAKAVVAEFAKGEIVRSALGLEARKPLRGGGIEALVECPVEKEHDLKVDCVD
jgi:hypothetical protein